MPACEVLSRAGEGGWEALKEGAAGQEKLPTERRSSAAPPPPRWPLLCKWFPSIFTTTLGGGACHCPPIFQGRSLQPRGAAGRGRVTGTSSVFTNFFFPMWRCVLGSKAPWQGHGSLLLGFYNCLSITYRAGVSHTERCPHTTLGACSRSGSDMLQAWGRAHSSITAHQCRCPQSALQAAKLQNRDRLRLGLAGLTS